MSDAMEQWKAEIMAKKTKPSKPEDEKPKFVAPSEKIAELMEKDPTPRQKRRKRK